LEKGYYVYYIIIDIFREENQKEPISVNIPLFAKFSSAGGNSLALTVDKKQVIRYNLNKDYELEIMIKDIRKTPQTG